MSRRTHISLKGFVQPFVIDHTGKTILEGPIQRNLLLDAGLNRLATVHMADLFSVCVKGTGTTPTLEDVTGDYSQNANTTVFRNTGTRDFTVDDVGKLIRWDSGDEALITAYTAVDQVEVDRVQTVGNDSITLYHVNQTGLAIETGMRKLTGLYDKPLADDAVTGDTASQFTSDDVGKYVYFPSSDQAYEILTFIDGQNVTVDISEGDLDISSATAIVYEASIVNPDLSAGRTQTYSGVGGENSTIDGTGGSLGLRTMKRTFIFDPEPANSELITGVYARSGGTLTKSPGGRDFTSDDVGKVLAFDNGDEYKITAQATTSATITPASGPTSTAFIHLYGFTSYSEVGMSDDGSPGDNLNIRVLLASAVPVSAPTGKFPGQQLKIAYTFKAQVTPKVSTYSSPVVNDSGGQMSGSKSGNVVVEALGLSAVSSDGTTDISFAGLEPCEPASMGISPSTAALVPLNGPDRSANVAVTPLTPGTFTPGIFSQSYSGAYALNDAIATNWGSLMIWDDDSSRSYFTHLFSSAQRKDGTHVLTVSWSKTWNRDLS